MCISRQYDLCADDRHNEVHKDKDDIDIHWAHGFVLLMLVQVYSEEIAVGVKYNEEQKNAHQTDHKFLAGLQDSPLPEL